MFDHRLDNVIEMIIEQILENRQPSEYPDIEFIDTALLDKLQVHFEDWRDK